MRTRWNLNQLLGYLRTWSATQKFIAARGFDPVDSLEEELGTVWRSGRSARNEMAMHLRVGSAKLLTGPLRRLAIVCLPITR